MEKYRKYGDAATGINPFVLLRTPTTISILIATLLFPLRLLLSFIIIVLLFPLDTMAYFFFLLPGISKLSQILIAPCQRGLLRCILFFLGNISIERASPRAMNVSSRNNNNNNNNSVIIPNAGDIVVANLQSVWDICVLEVAGQLPYSVIAFYVGAANNNNNKVLSEMEKLNKKNDSSNNIKFFEPSPVQRWRVWWHIYYSGSLEFLRAATIDKENNNNNNNNKSINEIIIDLKSLQTKCNYLGVSLILFPEGSCTNGKGMLQIPSIQIKTQINTQIFTAAIDYNTTLIHTVLTPAHVFSLLFAMSVSLHGSRDPAWYTPTFPTVMLRFAIFTELNELTKELTKEIKELVVDGGKLRQVLCLASRSRRALAVGLNEKCNFVKACMNK